MVGSFCEFTSKTRFNRSWKIIKDEIYKIPILMNLTCMAVIRLSVPHPAWKVCGRWWNRRTWRRTMNSSPTTASSSSSTCICLQLSVLRTGKMWHLHGFPWCIAKHISQRWCYIYITSTHSLHWHKCYNLHCLIDLAMLECSTHTHFSAMQCFAPFDAANARWCCGEALRRRHFWQVAHISRHLRWLNHQCSIFPNWD